MHTLATIGGLFAISGLALSLAGAQTGDRLIVPGQQLGTVRVDANFTTTAKRLGKPDFGDAGLGHYWNTWNARKSAMHTGIHHSLDVYTENTEADGPYVRIIRVTSPWFKTANGLSTECVFSQAQHQYPALKRMAQYAPQQVPVSIAVYDEVKRGLAFEFLCDQRGRVGPQSPCLAILVHTPGKQVNQFYLSLTSYLTEKPSFDAGATQTTSSSSEQSQVPKR